jgi:integrase
VRFKSYSQDVIAGRLASGRLRPTTAERYQQLLREHAYPVLGALKVAEIRPGHVRQVLERMAERGSALATRCQCRAVVGMVLRQAVGDGLVALNPVTATTRPSPGRSHKKVPTGEQVRVFLESLAGSPWQMALVVAAPTGCRRSEVLGLQWSDVANDYSSVTIRRGLHRLPGGALGYLEPKSSESWRTVPLLPVVAQRLKAHRAEQAQRRLALGSGWDSSYGDLECERGDGSPLRPDACSKAFKRLASKAGLDPSTSLHSLRHAFCTELGRRHVHPKIVSALAGHSSTAFTLTTYTAAWEEGVDEAAAALAQALDLGAK